MADLGLELAEDKTKEINFNIDDFDFLGFTFSHLRISARGNIYYLVQPSEKSLKKFKEDLKALTNKSCTFSFEEWCKRLNPVLRGKYNYFLIANRACKEVYYACQKAGKEFHGIAYRHYERLDGYVRERLRTAFSNRGRKHGNRMQAKLLHVKYNIEFFVDFMGLVCGELLQLQIRQEGLTPKEYVAYKASQRKKKKTSSNKTKRFYKLAYAK